MIAKREVRADEGRATMLRIWLRRRRLLLLSSALTLILIPSLIFTIGINAGAYVISADDDAYDYDAIDGVHAMVHQMGHNSKSKRDVIGVKFLTGSQPIRAEERHTYKIEEETDKKKHGYVVPSNTYVSNGLTINRGPPRPGALRRKIQDSEDVPPDEVKGYAFLRRSAERPTKDTRFTKVVVEDEMYHAYEDEDDYGENDGDEAKDVIIDPKEQEDEDEDEDYREEGENAYEYWARNPEFRKGDFDDHPKNYSKTKPVLKYEELPENREAAQRQRNPSANNDNLLVRSSEQRVGVQSMRNVQNVDTIPRANSKQGDLRDSKLRVYPDCDPKLGGCKPIINIDDTNNDNRARLAPHGRRVARFNQQETNLYQKKQLTNSAQQQMDRTNELRPAGHQSPADQSKDFPAGYKDLTSKHKSLKGTLIGSQISPSSAQVNVEYAHSLPLHEQPATQLQMPQLPPQQGEVVSNAGFPVVKDKIYWSEHVEGFVPTGVTQEDISAFQEKISHQRVQEMFPPQWNRCGRPKNQYVVLEDGSAACARYRTPHTKMLQGEILSFYLARLLGIDSVPVCVLAEVNATAPLWRSVEPAAAGWEDGQLVVLIQWIDGLDKQWSQVKMPPLILSAFQRGATVDRNHPALLTMSAPELSELLQWSDLIIYDYITGHYDRVASMQDGAEREQKKSIMSESIRNLRKVPLTNKLWFVDNESGLFDGYELMKYGKKNGPRFIRFHQEILQTMCLFRRHLVEGVERLAQHDDPQAVLIEYTQSHEPLYRKLPSVSKIKYFKKFFHSRLKDVVSWVEKCRSS